MRLGTALVLSAPSGAGKTTLVKKLIQEFPDFGFSVSFGFSGPFGFSVSFGFSDSFGFSVSFGFSTGRSFISTVCIRLLSSTVKRTVSAT